MTKQPLGGTISADELIGSLGPDLEEVLERERPLASLPRYNSIPLVSSPSGSEFTYVVKPIGRLERLHGGWLKQLVATDPLQ